MSIVMPARLARLVERARQDPRILAVLLFGSRARGEASARSDTDVCLVLASAPRSRLAGAEVRLEYLAEYDLDIVVFQQLPLPIRVRILKEAHVLFVRDEDALYTLAYRTAQQFELFRPAYRLYLDQVERG
jgi:predicted nucleotidyltransferase